MVGLYIFKTIYIHINLYYILVYISYFPFMHIIVRLCNITNNIYIIYIICLIIHIHNLIHLYIVCLIILLYSYLIYAIYMSILYDKLY